MDTRLPCDDRLVIGVAAVDETGTQTYVDEAFCRMVGWSRSELLGARPPFVYWPPEEVERIQDALRATLRAEGPAEGFELRFRRRDGSRFDALVFVSSVPGAVGAGLCWLATVCDISQRKRAQRDLEESEMRLRLALEAGRLGAWQWSIPTDQVQWSPSLEAIHGFEPGSFPGTFAAFREEIHPDDRDRVFQLIRESVEHGREHHVQYRIVRRDGAVRWVEGHGRLVRDGEGRPDRMVGVCSDVSARVEAEGALRASEARFRLMADHAPVLIWVADANNRAVYFNAPWLAFTGAPIEAQVGDGWLALIHPDDRAATAASCQEHVDRRLPFSMEFRLRHHDGGYRWVQDTGQPLLTPDGTFTGYVGSCVDIHERKATEGRIRLALLDAAPDAFVITDADGRIVLTNMHADRLFGYDRDDLLGQPVEILVPVRDRAAHARHRARYFESARVRPMGAGLELYGRRKDGTEFPVEISLSPLRTEEGTFAISAIRDTTDRKAADEERARLLHERAAHAEASRLKDEFVATVSHELRTPLNAVMGWTSMLLADTLGPAQARHAIETIGRNADALARLLGDLLDISRIVTGKLRLETAVVDLADTLRAAVEAVRPAADAKRVRLDWAVADAPPCLVDGDAGRLQQSIWNLLVNAVKFSDEEGRVEIHLGRSDRHVRLVVRDHGRGIAPDFLPHVFDRFRQSDTGATDGGLGLGLAIVRSVVELHGGTVEAQSEGPGRGATFTLLIPGAEVGAPAAATREPPAAERLDGIRVLVVDDRADERELIKVVLERQGATAATADSAADARRQLGDGLVVDLLIADIAMPGEDGYTLLQQIRQLQGIIRDVRAIAVTAHAATEERDRALKAGFERYLSKPFDPPSLIGAVAAAVRAPRPGRPGAGAPDRDPR